MKVVELGRISYAAAEEVQLARHAEVCAGAEDTLYLLEHNPVITVGRQGGLENLHLTPEALAAMGVELARSARGGNITCHFPGQLVAYPIFRVGRRPGGVRRFFEDMEEAVIRTAARFGVTAHRAPGRPGVWAGAAKLCSMGIAVKRWTTYHGLALNVGRDLSLFSAITLCGLPDATPTSLSLLAGRDIDMKDVRHALAQEFRDLFAHPAVA